MKFLYAARMVRYDLLFSVTRLARETHRWSIACDRRLFQLASYAYNTQNMVRMSIIGDPIDQLQLVQCSDADFSGDHMSSKSTSGVIMLVGPNSFFILDVICKKQTVVSHSSSESELVAVDTHIRTSTIPILDFWDYILDVYAPHKKDHQR